MAKWNEFEKQRQVTEPAQENNSWKNMLAMLSMVNNTAPETMAGYGLGRLLKRWIGTAWDDYLRKKETNDGAATTTNEAGNGNPLHLESGLMKLPKDMNYDPLSGAVIPQPGLEIANTVVIPELPNDIKDKLPQGGL